MMEKTSQVDVDWRWRCILQCISYFAIMWGRAAIFPLLPVLE